MHFLKGVLISAYVSNLLSLSGMKMDRSSPSQAAGLMDESSVEVEKNKGRGIW